MDGTTDTFHFTGESTTKEVEGSNGKLYEWDGSGLIYHCDVKVNLRNAKRFAHNDTQYSLVQQTPHELYEMKAKHLYHKIREYFEEEWWD